MSEYITRREYEEHNLRMDDEHKRQNARISSLEETVRQIGELTTSVREMAISMKSMLEELRDQSDRLEVLEQRDGEMWRKLVGYLITTAAGIVVGYLFKQIGM